MMTSMRFGIFLLLLVLLAERHSVEAKSRDQRSKDADRKEVGERKLVVYEEDEMNGRRLIGQILMDGEQANKKDEKRKNEESSIVKAKDMESTDTEEKEMKSEAMKNSKDENTGWKNRWQLLKKNMNGNKRQVLQDALDEALLEYAKMKRNAHKKRTVLAEDTTDSKQADDGRELFYTALDAALTAYGREMLVRRELGRRRFNWSRNHLSVKVGKKKRETATVMAEDDEKRAFGVRRAQWVKNHVRRKGGKKKRETATVVAEDDEKRELTQRRVNWVENYVQTGEKKKRETATVVVEDDEKRVRGKDHEEMKREEAAHVKSDREDEKAEKEEEEEDSRKRLSWMRDHINSDKISKREVETTTEDSH